MSVILGTGDTPIAPVISLGWLIDPASPEAVAAVKRMRQAYAGIVKITLGEEFAPGPSAQSERQNSGVHSAHHFSVLPCGGDVCIGQTG